MNKLIACTAAAALPVSAIGGVSFTFDDPGSGAEFSYTAPQAPGTGELLFRQDVPVQLELAGESEAAQLGSLSFDAYFDASFEVGAIISNPGDLVTTAQLSGEFAWRDVQTDEVIVSGEFADAVLVAFAGAGAIIAGSGEAQGSLSYTPGEVLLAEGITSLINPEDAVWTLTNLTFESGQQEVDVAGERYLNSFEANAGYTGTAYIPAPGTLALFSVGLLVAWRRR